MDDASIVDLCKYMLHSRFFNNKKFKKYVRMIVYYLNNNFGYFGFYASLIIASKFLNSDELLFIIKSGKNYWQSDFWLGRTVGGIEPALRLNPHTYKEYEQLLDKAGNVDALNTFRFHYALQNDEKTVTKFRKYLISSNPSIPGKIYYPKILLLSSALQNKNVHNLKSDAVKAHSVIRTDPYYKRLIFNS